MEEKADEKRTISAILQGDQAAFRFLVEKYQGLVSHIVFRMINNSADREDACQDVFLKIYRSLSGFRFQSKLSTWIAKIAYNTSLNYLEKRKLPLFEDRISGEVSLQEYAHYTDSPAKILETDETRRCLEREIRRIPVQYRTILTLYHIEEMSYREIGEIMELPEGTVKNYLFRARKYLKEKLSVKYQPEEL